MFTRHPELQFKTLKQDRTLQSVRLSGFVCVSVDSKLSASAHLWSDTPCCTSTEVNHNRGDGCHRSAPTQGALMWAAATEHILPSSLPGAPAARHVSVRYLPVLPFPAGHQQRQEKKSEHLSEFKIQSVRESKQNTKFKAILSLKTCTSF